MTTQFQEKRFAQHVPVCVRKCRFNNLCKCSVTHGDAIFEKLIKKSSAFICKDRFIILSRSRSNYDLKVLEAVYIKSRQTSLGKRKKKG